MPMRSRGWTLPSLREALMFDVVPVEIALGERSCVLAQAIW
jgi:hypothetical protein